MQKIINGIAIFSGAVALGVVGLGGYVFIRKDAIIDGVKEKVMDAVMPSIGGGIMESIPDLTGPAPVRSGILSMIPPPVSYTHLTLPTKSGV